MNEHGDSTEDLPITTPEIEEMKAEMEAVDSDHATVDAMSVIEKTRPVYVAETARLQALNAFIHNHSVPLSFFSDYELRPVSPEVMSDNLVFAREQAVIAAYRAIRGICRQSNLVVLAGRVLDLACEQGEAE